MSCFFFLLFCHNYFIENVMNEYLIFKIPHFDPWCYMLLEPVSFALWLVHFPSKFSSWKVFTVLSNNVSSLLLLPSVSLICLSSFSLSSFIMISFSHSSCGLF